MREFLKLDNKLILKLKIKPLSPLLIKLGNKEKYSEDKDGNYIGFLTTESSTGTKLEYNGGSEKISEDNRKGEIYIPGSSLRGAFRDRTLDIFDNNKDEIEKLYGVSEGEKALKTRIFIGDAFLYKVDDRKRFYSDNDKISESLKDILKSRSITPIDHFSGNCSIKI